jgi:hypothetical protein
MSGAAFKDLRTSVVPSELLEFNAAWFLTRGGNNPNISVLEHLIPSKQVFLVGNLKSKFSGDIDIGVDWGETEPTDEQLWNKIGLFCSQGLRLKQSQYKIVKGWNQAHFLVPLINKTGKKIFGKYGSDGVFSSTTEPGMIQIDLLFGNKRWMQSTMSGPSDITSYKALYRTNLLAEIVSAVEWKTVDSSGETVYNKLSFDYKFGVFHKTWKIVPPTGKQKKHQVEPIARNLMFNDPNMIAKTLFGIQYGWEDIDSYEKISRFISMRTGQYWYVYNTALKEFVKRLVKDGLPIPPELFYLKISE